MAVPTHSSLPVWLLHGGSTPQPDCHWAGFHYAIGYNAYHNRLNVPAMADASGTNGLHGTANTYNWIQSGLLTQSLGSDQGNHMTLFEALTHTVEVCKTAASAWTNTSFTAQTGTPTVKFNATPSGNRIDTVVGLSNGPQSIYTGLAAIVRFNPSGFIDAYNGTGYSALTSVPYSAGTKYSFWFQVNIPAQTYNVYVTPEGGSQVQIGANYAFRVSAPTLNNVTYHAELGSDHICSFNLPLAVIDPKQGSHNGRRFTQGSGLGLLRCPLPTAALDAPLSVIETDSGVGATGHAQHETSRPVRRPGDSGLLFRCRQCPEQVRSRGRLADLLAAQRHHHRSADHATAQGLAAAAGGSGARHRQRRIFR